MRRVASILFYPLVMGAAMAVAAWGVLRGIAPHRLFPPLFAGVVAAVIAAERLLPCRADWNRPQGDVRTDLIHLLVSNLLAPQLYLTLLVAACAPVAARLSGALGANLWPRSWPLGASLLLALVVAEFGQYWAHRAAHRRPLLWRLHAVHHSPRRLYWLNAGRDHPLGVLLLYASEIVPLILLGCDPRTILLFTLFTAVNGLLRHANVEVRLGPLNWIVSMAELHRWHHAEDARQGDVNFGANLILWDVVFGTRSRPRPTPPERLGLAGAREVPPGYLAQLASPFAPRRG